MATYHSKPHKKVDSSIAFGTGCLDTTAGTRPVARKPIASEPAFLIQKNKFLREQAVNLLLDIYKLQEEFRSVRTSRPSQKSPGSPSAH